MSSISLKHEILIEGTENCVPCASSEKHTASAKKVYPAKSKAPLACSSAKLVATVKADRIKLKVTELIGKNEFGDQQPWHTA